MTRLYHLTTLGAWEEAQRSGEYRAPSLETEGYIHLSLEHQWPLVRQRFYQSVPSLLLLELDRWRLTAVVRLEEGEPGELYPHLYGPLNLEAVLSVQALP